ncbi:hypothetical protein ACFYOK_36550 [Microbispora bryophytorum]|uniref:hypothetical protein n=1 Tax=Microbispora bryophytorum TaxID=1460882 RepID=UPI0033CC9F1E
MDGVASGTQASIAVPADALTDGWKLRWRLRAVAGASAAAWSDWRQITVDVVQPGEESLAQTTGPVIRTDQNFTSADATDAAVKGILSVVKPPVDEWFHVAGTYDAATRTATV